MDDKCIGDPREFGCSIYKSLDNCTADPLNLGRTGEGTDICGTYVKAVGIDVAYVIPTESCQCEWGDGKCNLTYAVYPEVFGTNLDYFNCSKYFDIGDCINYERQVSWTAAPTDIIGYTSGIHPEILKAAICESGTQSRSCGRPLLKLPAFSLFAFYSSLSLIFVVYYFRRKI
jgi:hypothetical protein